jgi:hypothetical protein
MATRGRLLALPTLGGEAEDPTGPSARLDRSKAPTHHQA